MPDADSTKVIAHEPGLINFEIYCAWIIGVNSSLLQQSYPFNFEGIETRKESLTWLMENVSKKSNFKKKKEKKKTEKMCRYYNLKGKSYVQQFLHVSLL